MSEAQEVMVPATVYVPCPALCFKNASVSRRCPACPHFKGFIEVQAGGDFEARYRVNCAHPVARRVLTVEV